MLAGRLFSLAKDIVQEYREFAIINQLSEAINVSSQRATPQAQLYVDRARHLRAWAQDVIAKSKLTSYPVDIQKLLTESKYAMGLPANIAKVIFMGFPEDINRAISSSELGVYRELAATTLNELSATDVVAKAFKIETIAVPAAELSFDVMLPRKLFENGAEQYAIMLLHFVRVMMYFEEIATGSRRSPTLVYSTTSDPITGLSIAIAAGWGFLQFYKLILEVADKQLSLLKTIKEFRASSLGSIPDIEERTQAIVENALTEAVQRSIASIPSRVPTERVNEITVAISKDAQALVTFVGKGARVGITIESLGQLSEIPKQDLKIESLEAVNQLIESQRGLEQRLEQAIALIDAVPPALIAQDDQK